MLLLAVVVACSACSYSALTPEDTSRLPATTLPGQVTTAPGTVDAAASELTTATPLPVVTLSPTDTLPPAPTPTANPIRVVKAVPATQVIKNEDYHLNNCGGTTPLHQPFSDAAQVSTDVVISDQATRSDGTTIAITESLRSELVRQVELAYQDKLDAARATLDASEMMAPPYTRWYVVVIWEDSVFSASISFPSDQLTTTATYTYTQHVPRMGPLKTMPCTP